MFIEESLASLGSLDGRLVSFKKIHSQTMSIIEFACIRADRVFFKKDTCKSKLTAHCNSKNLQAYSQSTISQIHLILYNNSKHNISG